VDEEQKRRLDEIVFDTRIDGDTKADCAIRTCKRMAPLVTLDKKYDRDAVAYIAGALEASQAIVKKWARAGRVLESDIFPEEGPYSIDFYAEVFEWPRGEWETIADLADMGDLNAADLKRFRTFVQQMRGARQHWCPSCGHTAWDGVVS